LKLPASGPDDLKTGPSVNGRVKVSQRAAQNVATSVAHFCIAVLIRDKTNSRFCGL
jgi:hypothetical protein